MVMKQVEPIISRENDAKVGMHCGNVPRMFNVPLIKAKKKHCANSSAV
jgi:hypothetical protein